jgi:ribosomal protein L37AE/L43A
MVLLKKELEDIYMDITCPSCQYIRKENSHLETPIWRCPACEIVYEKYEKNMSKMNDLSEVIAERQATTEAIAPPEKPSIKPISEAEPSKLAILISDYLRRFNVIFRGFLTPKGGLVVLVVFIFGFFSGREYFRYEVRTAIQDTFTETRKGLSSIWSGIGTTEVAASTEEKEIVYFPMEMSDKYYNEHGPSKYDDTIDFTMFIKNPYDKDIRAFSAVIIFTDILNNEIKRLNFTHKETVAAGDTFEWEGSMDYNQIKSSDKELRYAKLEDMDIKLKVKRIVYADGSAEQFD